MEARFIVGPPGTGKTHIFLVEKYEECFSKYNPEKIVLLSHTNVAVGQILDAIMKLKEVKEKGYTLLALNMYFKNNRIKLEVGMGKSKKAFDKRKVLKEREQKREIERAVKNNY